MFLSISIASLYSKLKTTILHQTQYTTYRYKILIVYYVWRHFLSLQGKIYHFSLLQMVSKLPNTYSNDVMVKEIESYEKQLIDIDTLSEKAQEALKEKDDLRHKLELLEKRVKVIK